MYDLTSLSLKIFISLFNFAFIFRYLLHVLMNLEIAVLLKSLNRNVDNVAEKVTSFIFITSCILSRIKCVCI